MGKRLLSFLLALGIGCSLAGAVLVDDRFDGENLPEGWSSLPGAQVANGSLEIVQPDRVQGTRCITKTFRPEDLSGKILRISGEMKGEAILPGAKPYFGGKIMLVLSSGKDTQWLTVDVPTGTFDWQSFDRVFRANSNLDSARLVLGFQDSAGKLWIRNLKLESLGQPVELSAANMGLRDEKAGDGVGGWSDQGPGNDGRGFERYLNQNLFSGVPFSLARGEKNVIVLRSTQFPAGLEKAELPVVPAVAARNLYLMHTICWGGAMPVGSLTLHGENGRTGTIEMVDGVDVKDWWHPHSLKNGYVGLRSQTAEGGSVGLYLSKFPINPALGRISKITFNAGGAQPIWIIMGVTLSDLDVTFPEDKPHVVAADEEWRPIQRVPRNMRKAGSALDVSGWLRKEQCGDRGRLIINREGRFAFEKEPDRPVRFFTCAMEEPFNSHEDIKLYVQELRKNGYNMLRPHFLDSILMQGAKRDLEFNQKNLDNFDFLIAEMKRNGIYLLFDLMTSWNGYSPGAIWQMEDRNLKKNELHFDPAVRENWRKGVEQILCRKNPYTGTRLIDDPILVMAVGFNEQEFAFRRPFREDLNGPAWRKFLADRYGSIEKYNQAKGTRYAKFEEVPTFPPNNYQDNDVAAFISKVELDTLHWYREQLNEMGYRGWLANYNMLKDQHYNLIRTEADYVAMNSYHDHPVRYSDGSELMQQRSSIGTAGQVFRDFASTRLAGKPMIITEHGHVYWNRYRYEQAFVIGAYAAFQGFDGITCHASPFSLREGVVTRSFGLFTDPIGLAAEYLTFFAYVRGDVTEARTSVRIGINAGDVRKSADARSGLAPAQTRLALMTGFSVECTEDGRPQLPARKRELLLDRNGSTQVVTESSGFSRTVENAGDATADVALLKRSGILPESNRSDGSHLFESETGELFMDTSRNFLSVNTPRLQGVCAEAGTTAELADFEIREMSRPGNLAVVAIDGMKPIREAERLTVVYATDALASGMECAGPEREVRFKAGGLPTLLRTGVFTVALRNRQAEKLQLYPLDLAGNRLKKIEPVAVEGDRAVFRVDTARDGVSLFFEVVAEK